ncbi:hypothetical protein DKX38_020367 [Salix brachista]|uniref:Uncharacterized protein n=1 Tax=Salix brachista TaxID=2182728 RepID=A0A5N5KA51_9ROSI|nr:hypothetical protein DKX38_020367 [Salix brachista]
MALCMFLGLILITFRGGCIAGEHRAEEETYFAGAQTVLAWENTAVLRFDLALKYEASCWEIEMQFWSDCVPLSNMLGTSGLLSTFFLSCSAHFVYSIDRRSVFVDLRIHIPEKLLQLNDEIRAVQATNNYDNLKFYLYFSEPVLNSSAEILNSLNTSEGVVLPRSGENLVN